MPVSVGTDSGLALETRKGTGFYKVPSLKGVWYRGLYGHDGSVASLDDSFDPARLRDNYAPTGFKGYQVATRPVKGPQIRAESQERRQSSADRISADIVIRSRSGLSPGVYQDCPQPAESWWLIPFLTSLVFAASMGHECEGASQT
jgi:hypothetical protein